MNNELNPPDDVWVNYPLPWVEGRCIPETRLKLDGERWVREYRYPKPDADEENSDEEMEEGSD